VSPYQYNLSNELTSIPGVTYIYDNNGNVTSKTEAAGVTQYTWDYENRLKQVVLPGTAGTVNFKYDPFGRRIQKAFTQGATTTTTNYVYDGANLIEEVDQNGVVLARYTQTQNIDEPLSELRSSTTSYYQADGLGSVTSLSNSSAALVNTYTYDSFGKLTASTGTIVNPFRYTGRELDPETGIYEYRARYYDQNVGRFISEDPSELGALGEGTNLYVYVENNPTNYVDPYGLYTVLPGVPAPSPEIDALLKCIESKTGVPLVVTSTSTISKQHPAGTPHARGEAVDLRYPSDPDKVLCAAAGCGAGFGLDEKKHPSAQAKGPHIHLQIPAGKKGGHGDLPKAKCNSCSQ
jgi:RHS repeat-associated protein